MCILNLDIAMNLRRGSFIHLYAGDAAVYTAKSFPLQGLQSGWRGETNLNAYSNVIW